MWLLFRKGELISEDAKLIESSTRIPIWAHKLLARLMSTNLIPAIHSKRLGAFMGSGATKSTEIWDAVADKRRIIDEILTEWDHLELDSLIMNTLPFPAPRADAISKLTGKR